MKKLYIPGPVDVFDDVLDALGSQVIAHYGRDFVQLYHEVQDLLRRLIGSSGEIFLIPGAGTAGLDACVGSLLHNGQRIFIPSNGFFGDRLATVARASGADAVSQEFEWGTPIDPAEVRRGLKREKDIAAFAIVHHETSTGVLNPLADLVGVAHEAGLPVIVDAVASAGGVPLDVDGLGIEFLVTVGNKCLEAPPGLALVSVSPHGWEFIDRQSPGNHGWYLDLRTWRDYATRWASWHPYPVTLPTNVVMALDVALKRIQSEGLDRHFARYVKASEAVRKGLRDMGFTMLVDGEDACPVVSAVRARPEFPVSEMSHYLQAEHNIMIAGGIGLLEGKIFRIGHMGKASTQEYVDALLLAIGDFLRGKGLL